MVHFAGHPDMENVDDDIGVGTDKVEGGFQQEDGYEDPRGKSRVGHSIIDQEGFLRPCNSSMRSAKSSLAGPVRIVSSSNRPALSSLP
ncbi:hypothetical protein Y032_0689g1558 [Ancylostoma ceylanicum]|nr:hypothetical protein Y032_0689g1558 [Ancylostoma ceylanicum]